MARNQRARVARRKAARGNAERSGGLAPQIWVGLALVALGLFVGSQRRPSDRRRRPMRDYSGRSGLPLGVEASRGLASNAPLPPDILTPEALRPFTQTLR